MLGGGNISTFVHMVIIQDVMDVDSLVSPSWSLRIVKIVWDLELGDVSFDFGFAPNSMNELPRDDFLP